MAKTCEAGHKGCACGMACCSVSPTRWAQIREDARSGKNWAAEGAKDSHSAVGYGAACVCGAGLRTLEAATALKGVHGRPSGLCARHPGGTVFRESDKKGSSREERG